MSVVPYRNAGYVAPNPISPAEAQENANMEGQPLPKLIANSSSPQIPTILSRQQLKRRWHIAGCKSTDLERAIKKTATLKIPTVHIQPIAEYLDAVSSVQMYITGIMPKSVLANYFKKLNSSSQLGELVLELFNKFNTLEKDSQTEVTEIIDIFFSSASKEVQDSFFAEMALLLGKGAKKPSKDPFLEFVIHSLPRSLESLNLSSLGSYIRDKHVSIIADRMVNLQHLDFTGCYKLTDKAPESIARSSHIVNLRHLDFTGCNGFTDAAVASIAGSRYMANLRDLIFSGCYKLTDKAPESIATSPNMANLQHLDFTSCSWGLTDVAVAWIAGSVYMANLRRLILAHCYLITNVAVASIAGSLYMANLRYLDVSDTGVTAIGKDILRQSAYLTKLESDIAPKLSYSDRYYLPNPF